jgi:hypothetical protein
VVTVTRILTWLTSWFVRDVVYIVMDGARVVDVSAKLQGAELIRINEARALAEGRDGSVTNEDYRTTYDRMRIETRRVLDGS